MVFGNSNVTNLDWVSNPVLSFARMWFRSWSSAWRTLEEPSTRGWDNLVHIVDVRAAIDHNGKIAAYEYHGWQHG